MISSAIPPAGPGYAQARNKGTYCNCHEGDASVGKRACSRPLSSVPHAPLFGWSREQLAEHSDTAAETVKRFELRGSDPKRSTMLKWRRALEQAGVEFVNPTGKGEGVRFRSRKGSR